MSPVGGGRAAVLGGSVGPQLAATSGPTASGTPQTISRPSQVQEGDLLLWLAWTNQERSYSWTDATFTEVDTHADNSLTIVAGARVATGAEPAEYTGVFSLSDPGSAALLVFRGAIAPTSGDVYVDSDTPAVRSTITHDTAVDVPASPTRAVLVAVRRDSPGNTATRTVPSPWIPVSSLGPYPPGVIATRTLVGVAAGSVVVGNLPATMSVGDVSMVVYVPSA